MQKNTFFSGLSLILYHFYNIGAQFLKIKNGNLLLFLYGSEVDHLGLFVVYSFHSVPEYHYWVTLTPCLKEFVKRSVNFAQRCILITHLFSQFSYHLLMRFFISTDHFFWEKYQWDIEIFVLFVNFMLQSVQQFLECQNNSTCFSLMVHWTKWFPGQKHIVHIDNCYYVLYT